LTTGAVGARAAETRYVPWLARFKRSGRGEAELQLERVDDDGPDSRASTAARNGLKVAARGVLFEREELARELGLDAVPDDDAELVLHAYRRWAQDGIRRLRGVFAVFVWDEERECLLAARDHLGAEPVFYVRSGEEILFAASPMTLVAQTGVPRAPNRAMLVETFYSHWPFPEDTCLEGIRRILPGHILTIGNATTSSRRYWNPLDDLHEQGWVDANELKEFDALLERSVSQCLELGSCGIFLSGGLDSVSIAAVALDLTERRGLTPPLALSLAFPTPETTEEDVQLGVAAELGLPQIMLGLEESVAPDGLVRRALDLSADWPVPRTYLWSGPYQALADAGTERGARVIMTGAGGDEWLTVDLKLAADFIQALQFGNLYRFARSRLASFSVPAAPALRYVLWEYGLREVLRFHTRALLARRASAVLQARRRRAFTRAEIPWVAPDPRLRTEVRARREADVRRVIEPQKVGGRFHFYASDGAMVLDHPVISGQREDDYEVGRRAGAELLHPYWEPDLISFLFRVPPELLLRGGLEKGLVRSTIARRFPSLGFERQRKVVSVDYHYSVLRREGAEALRRLGGCKALAELGIVDGSQAEAVSVRAFAGSDFHDLHRAWELLNLETWVRQLL
jgi:asparagine synthetase B (glutamine-hydrolysing)